MPRGGTHVRLMWACSKMVPGPQFWNGVSHHYVGPPSLAFLWCITFSLYTDRIYCIVWVEYIAWHVIKLVVVCCCQLWVCVLLCIFFFCFTRVFFCVCHYILCHLYYYLMLVSLDCTSCVCKVYLLCIVCGHQGVLCPHHLCGFNGICSVCFLFFALYFVFNLQFKCLNVFVWVRVWL